MARTLCVLLTFLAWTMPAAAQPDKRLRAVLQELDAETGTISVLLLDEPKRKAPRLKTFSLQKPNLPVADAAGRPLPLAQLMPEDIVFLTLEEGDVAAIHRSLPSLHGAVSQVDAEKRTVEIKSKLGLRMLDVRPECKVVVAGREAGLDEVRVGQAALAIFSADGKTLLELKTAKTITPLVKLAKFSATLLDIDRERQIAFMLMNPHRGDAFLIHEFALTPDTTFALVRSYRTVRDLELEEVQRGTRAYYWIDVATRKLAHLDLEMPLLGRREIVAVDPKAGKLTVRDEIGVQETFLLAEGCEVRRADGERGSTADLRPGLHISCGLQLDRRHVEIIWLLKN